MTIPTPFLISLVILIAISLIASAVAVWVSIFKDDAREARLKWLEIEVDALKAEGLLKDEKIAAQAKQITRLQEQIREKEQQIQELRRDIRPGTL